MRSQSGAIHIFAMIFMILIIVVLVYLASVFSSREGGGGQTELLRGQLARTHERLDRLEERVRTLEVKALSR